jgi:DNA-binding CsgD family transcriptional regulator
MQKVNKKTEITKLLNDGKSVKEISENLKTNIAYVYKIKNNDKKNGCKSENVNEADQTDSVSISI